MISQSTIIRVASLILLVSAQDANAVFDAIIPNGFSSLEYVSGGVNIGYGPGTGTQIFWGRTFSTPSAGATAARAAVTAESATLLLGGNSIPLTAVRSVSAAAIAEALAGGLATGLTAANAAAAVAAAGYAGFQIGAPVSKFLGNTELQIGKSMCTATNTGWACDVQRPTVPKLETAWCSGYPSICAFSPRDAAFEAMTTNEGRPAANIEFRSCAIGEFSATCTFEYYGTGQVHNPGQGSELNRTAAKSTATKYTCPPYIDALNPMWSKSTETTVPEGTPCPSGRYNATPTGVEVQSRIAANSDPAFGKAVIEGLLERGIPVKATPEGIQGPARIVGQPSTTTTTNPDGTTRSETKTPTTSYTYGNSSVTYNTSNVTITNNAGAITTTTTTDAPAEATPECKADPSLPKCAAFGDAPTDKIEPKKTNVVFSEENIGLASGCPVPFGINVRTFRIELRYEPACALAPTIKPGLVALTSLSCLLFIVAMVSRP